MRQKTQLTILTVTALILSAGTAQAADWGNLKGRFVFDGSAPTPAAASITKDQQYCGKHNLVDEALLVNPENGGLQNAVVMLYLGRGDKAPEIHPDYMKLKDEPVVMDNSKCRFEPHVAMLWTERKLVLGNSDPVGHNTKIDSLSNPPTNFTIPANGTLEQTFSQSERLPVNVSCSIHPWMRGWLVVQETPYMAVTDENGEFEIPNLPAGKWTFMFWHEKAGYLAEVNVNGKDEKWSRGRNEVTVKAGDNDLGTLKVSPKLFDK